jgi:hypothetical protein
MPGCRQDREGSVVACERSQLHFKRRILGSRECESAGIDRDENGVNTLLGVSYSIDSGGTVSQRSCAHKLSLPDSQLFDLVTPLQTFRQTVERPNIIRVLCTPLNSTAQSQIVATDLLSPGVMALLSQQSCKRMRG